MNRWYDVKNRPPGEQIIYAGFTLVLVVLVVPWSHRIMEDQSIFAAGSYVLFLPYGYLAYKLIRQKSVPIFGGMVASILPIVVILILFRIQYQDYYQKPLLGMYLFGIAASIIFAGVLVTVLGQASGDIATTKINDTRLRILVNALSAAVATTIGFIVARFLAQAIGPYDLLGSVSLWLHLSTYSLNVGLGVFIYFVLFGFGRQWKQVSRDYRFEILVSVGAALITNVLLEPLLRIYIMQLTILILGLAIPLGSRYRSGARLALKNMVKIVVLVIACRIIYEFLRYQVFTGLLYDPSGFSLLVWISTLLTDGTVLLISLGMYERFFGTAYTAGNSDGEMKLRKYLVAYFRGDLSQELGETVD